MDELGDQDKGLREGPSKSQRKREMHALQDAAERQQRRALIRTALRDQEAGKTDASRKLFRFLRDELDQAANR